MKMTEHEWRERERERQALWLYVVTGEERAQLDRENGFEVVREVRDWEEWRKLEGSLKESGWELCEYGQVADWFTVSGYFRRPRG